MLDRNEPVQPRRSAAAYRNSVFLTLILLAIGLPPATATEVRAKPIRDGRVFSADFLEHHPDLKHRMEGVELLDAGETRLAANEFTRAARYADKVS